MILLLLAAIQDPAVWIDKLGDKDKKVRAEASAKLLELGEAAIPAVAKAKLKHHSKAVRDEAAELMPELVALSYFPPRYHEAAADAIRKGGADRTTRILKLELLMEVVGPSGWRFWELLLEDRDPILRADAARALMPPAETAILDDAAPTFHNRAYLPRLVEGMLKAGSLRAIVGGELVATQTFARTIWALATPEDLPKLEPLLTHANKTIRREMASALPFYDGAADEVWRRLLEDDDVDVRKVARGVVTELRFARLPDEVTKMLKSAPPFRWRGTATPGRWPACFRTTGPPRCWPRSRRPTWRRTPPRSGPTRTSSCCTASATRPRAPPRLKKCATRHTTPRWIRRWPTG
jgi:hypothetical protein